MKSFCFAIYRTKGHPQGDLRCAICYSMVEVEQFRRENSDIEIVRVVEEDKFLGESLVEAVERLVENDKLTTEGREVFKKILKGGFFIGRNYS